MTSIYDNDNINNKIGNAISEQIVKKYMIKMCSSSCDRKKFISLCMIVKDETDSLVKCLKSIKGLYDELLVAWSGANEETKKILLEHGANIIKYKWKKDFADARNVSIEKAAGEWILWLDADEYIDSSKIVFIRDTLKSTDFDLFCMYTSIIDADNKVTYRHVRKRLFRNGLGITFSGRVHEDVNRPNMKKIPVLDVDIFHAGYIGNDIRKKSAEYEGILREMREKDPDDIKPVKYLIDHFLHEGRFSEAVELFKSNEGKILKAGIVAPYILTDTAKCYFNLGNTGEAMKCCEIALSISPLPMTYSVMAGILMKAERIDEAIECLEKAKQIPRPEIGVVPTDLNEYLINPRLSLAKLFVYLGDKKKAAANLKEVIGLESSNKEAIELLGSL